MFTKRLKIYPKSDKKTTSQYLKILTNKECKSNTNAVHKLNTMYDGVYFEIVVFNGVS